MKSPVRKYTFEFLKQVKSTNLHASALLSAKLITSPYVITADFQTNGKGQGNNSWNSDPGMNLLASLVVFPENITASEQFYLSKITSVSIRELVYDVTKSKEIKIKWPNDILCGNRKISGILIENMLTGNAINSSVIGVGINVNQTDFGNFPVKATSLKQITHGEMDVSAMLEKFTGIFDYWYEVMENRDFQQINRNYLGNLYGLFELKTFRRGNETFDARIMDVETDGRLVLQLKDNRKEKFLFKEVKLGVE